MTSAWNQELEELKWLQANPSFKMRPATIREFMGPKYLNEDNIREGVLEALVEIFGEKVDSFQISPIRRACFTGGIGIGKTTLASIALSYMVHWVSCLKDPQGYFRLMKDSPIAFMMMSTSMKQANDVIFEAVKARINRSPWFKEYCNVINPKMTTQLHFPNQIHIVPGTSEENSFEGYNILAGVVDEGDSHKVTARKDYADAGYDTINSRIASRFTNFKGKKNRGLIIAIGQMKSKGGFMARKYKQFLTDPDAVAVKMTIWDSYGWHNYTTDPDDVDRGVETAPRDSFYFDSRRKQIISKEAAAYVTNQDLIEVPMTYMDQFKDDPVKALRDLAGIPPEVDDPFISQTDKIMESQDAWHVRYDFDPISQHSTLSDIVLHPRFKACDDYRRVIHIDTAYSAEGDALGFSMGHIPERVEVYNQERPVIVFDLLMRLKARSGTQISFSQVREFIYMLRDDLGYNIDLVTLDGFETADFIQELNKNRIKADYNSVDKKKTAYELLREAINENRAEFPKYMTKIRESDTKPINIAYKELSELTDTGKKIDHPPLGSKDVADGMAGVTFNLMSSSKYAREARAVYKDEYDTNPNLSQFVGVEKSDGTIQPLSFDEWTKSKESMLQNQDLPGVDFNLMRGPGGGGFIADDTRLW